MNKAKTLDPSGQASGSGNQGQGPHNRNRTTGEQLDHPDDLTMQMEAKSDADIMESINR